MFALHMSAFGVRAVMTRTGLAKELSPQQWVSFYQPLGGFIMSPSRIVGLAIFAFSFASFVYAQDTLKGEVATVDEMAGKIGIKLSGTVGSGDTAAPTNFKVEDGLVFNAVKPGDKVSIVVERTGGDPTIKKLTKE
jgi:Cu/Ag efflux protein CusF